MKTIQITKDLLNNKLENKPTRFDMAINFYCCIKRDDKYYLVTYYYNPAWNLYYPFYDDINKTPVFKQSTANTYQELINETDQVLDIDLNSKLKLAHQRFKELIGCTCEIKQSKINQLYELKFSKTANTYSIYKLFNFIMTKVENLDIILNPKHLKCELFELDNLDQSKIVSNAIWFCEQSINELKENAITLN